MSSGPPSPGRDSAPGRILVVDDDPEMARMVAEALQADGHTVEFETEWKRAVDQAVLGGHELVITDVRMGERSGLDLLAEVTRRSKDTLVVLMTAFGTLESAIQAVKEGAFDYVAKPFKVEEIRLVARRALDQRRLLRENREMRAALSGGAPAAPRIIGRSPAMVEVYKTVARVAPTEATVLIRGESGTGKELIARTIHENSPRAAGPFQAVNCAAIPANLLESELFGHTRGAFTGATASAQGILPSAAGGTVLLDEIGDMPLALQAKILRAIELREVKPVGRPDPLTIDVRILAATNQDLLALVKEGAFREDLYYRINVVTITLPPLRDRPEDIPALAEHFARIHAVRNSKPTPAIPPATLRLLSRYPWPGNVRELEHAIERGIALAAGPVLQPEDLPLETREPAGAALLSLEELERGHLVRVLKATRGNRQEAAAILGIDRKTLYRKLLRYGIEGSEQPTPSSD
jgi:two-component system, NtrC family, response regulator AtoC